MQYEQRKAELAAIECKVVTALAWTEQVNAVVQRAN